MATTGCYSGNDIITEKINFWWNKCMKNAIADLLVMIQVYCFSLPHTFSILKKHSIFLFHKKKKKKGVSYIFLHSQFVFCFCLMTRLNGTEESVFLSSLNNIHINILNIIICISFKKKKWSIKEGRATIIIC